MSNIEKLFKIYRLHKLIKQGFSGSIEDYAEKLNISRGCVYNYKDDLEGIGAEIQYSRATNKFVYINNFEFKIELNFSPLEEKDMKKYKGGSSFFLPFNFLYGRNIFLSLIK